MKGKQILKVQQNVCVEEKNKINRKKSKTSIIPIFYFAKLPTLSLVNKVRIFGNDQYA